MNKKNQFLSFFVCLCITIVFTLLLRDSIWIGDADDYWIRGTKIRDSGFSILSIDGFRGYAFPLYLALVGQFGKSGFYIINSIMISFLTVYLLPYISTTKITLPKCLFALLTLFFFFYGLFIYPLADLYALVLCITSICCVKKAMQSKKAVMYIIFIIASGLFSYLSYNTRTIYLFVCPTIILYAIIATSKKTDVLSVRKKAFYTSVTAALHFIGIFIGAIPQLFQNYFISNSFSLKVPTEGLMLQQLYWGLRYQRYDTYTANPIYPFHNPPVYFIDPTGVSLLTVLQNELGGEESWSNYILLFIKYPIKYISIYLRHVINFLFPCWPEIYVKNLNSSKWGFGIICILFFMVFFIALIKNLFLSRSSLLLLLPILVPAMLIIPGAVEYRFSLPIYIYVISQLCYNLDYKNLLAVIKRHYIKYILILIGISWLCFSQWIYMLSNEKVSGLLM